MKKRTKAVLVLLAAAFGVFVYGRVRRPVPQPPTFVPFPVVRRDLKASVKASGTVEPRNLVAVRSPVQGRVEKVFKEVGAQVWKGSPMAEMSSADRAAILDESLGAGATTFAKWSSFYKPTPILSPVAGLVIARSIVPGETLPPGSELFVIADELIIIVRADETDVTAIKVGQKASVRLDAYPDKPFTAEVLTVGLRAERHEGVSVYRVELRLAGQPKDLKTGMSAEAEFPTLERLGILAVPLPATLGLRGQKAKLFVAESPQKAPAWREVELGASDGRFVEAVEGLKEGEAVFVPRQVLEKKPAP